MTQPDDKLDSTKVMDALRGILDPEFGLSIVDLGLVYEVLVEESSVRVTMTLTTPHCPAGQVILDGVRSCVESLSGGRAVDVVLTWEPAWTPDLMSPEASEALGWTSR